MNRNKGDKYPPIFILPCKESQEIHVKKNKSKEITMKGQSTNMHIFEKIRSFFGILRSPASISCPLELHFQILYKISDERVQEALINHIEQWHCMIPRLTVEPLREKIPHGCIGVMEIRRGEKLIRRQYLKIQEEYAATMSISYL